MQLMLLQSVAPTSASYGGTRLEVPESQPLAIQIHAEDIEDVPYAHLSCPMCISQVSLQKHAVPTERPDEGISMEHSRRQGGRITLVSRLPDLKQAE